MRMLSNGKALHGFDLFGEAIDPPKRGRMTTDFYWPPFSVFRQHDKDWQKRKRDWLNFGIKPEIRSRTDASPGLHLRPAYDYSRGDRGDGAGKPIPDRDLTGAGASIFDPVLAELMVRWFCPPGGQILDPFAGGACRGIVATLLGRRYHGIELRAIQTAANQVQADLIDPSPRPTWITGDARVHLAQAPTADMILSCPPYHDLEVYSDDPDPADLSGMTWERFLSAYREIISKSMARLMHNRFAVWVVSDIRDPDGFYRNLPGETVDAFRTAGGRLYNEAILVTAVGSLPVRINPQFRDARKIGRTHQIVQVYVKGDASAAAARIPLEGRA
jgi:hypothetical protein